MRRELLERLSDIEDIRVEPMFGGLGLSVGDAFCGIVFQGRVYLQTDEATRRKHVALGMGPFRFFGMKSLETFYEVPSQVLADRDLLVAWVRQAATLEDPPPASS